MRPPAAVVDTNVVVSGVLTSRRESPTVQILDGMLKGQIPFFLSAESIAEYRAVLLRPKIRERHRLKEQAIDEILIELIANGRLREVERSGSTGLPAGDDHLWALMAKEPSALLVTGDQMLIDHPPESRAVLLPRAFLDLLEI